ncbi:hypothetical protein KP509_31G005300 [Ceratopteris richardii]|uniref:Glycosyltransferase n=1 Tax=Ceratopteris richardii TaxID=49495 RepID=A0A8T2QVG4_CERRI|nr:hypothetical protein KP509_31G005300 [Ceratopteris richardii]
MPVMVFHSKNASFHRVLVGLCATAFFLFCISLQTHLFWSADEVSVEEQEEQWIMSKEPPEFSFVVKLLTYDRLHSLIRCLDSLAAADYGDNEVKLHVFIDHFPNQDHSTSFKPPMLAQQVESKLKESHAILDYVHKFKWAHGAKEIHYRTQNAGLQGQWLEAWWPVTDHEFAFMVEDDMCLSPLYFKYLKKIIQTYYYDPSNYDPIVYGISLQRPRFVPGKHGNKLQVDDATRLFLYQLVGTWGQLLFPKPWREFRLWYDIHKSSNLKPVLEGMVTTGWYNRSGERIWTPWFIKFAYVKGYFNLYTHFSSENSLSASYRDKGVNTKKDAGPDSVLIGSSGIQGLNLWDMRPLNQLKRYDFCFHEVKQGMLVQNAHDIISIVPSFQENGTIVLVNALDFPEDAIRNWLCQFSKFGIRNYMILLDDHGLGKDLSQRGHPVMQLNSRSIEKNIHEISSDNISHITKDLTTAQAVMMVLQAHYNVWLTDISTIWLTNPFPRLHIGNHDMLGFAEATGEVFTGFLYIKGSQRVMTFWRNVCKGILHKGIFRTSMGELCF